MTRTTTAKEENEELYMKVSLWILPPRTLRHRLSEQIVRLSHDYDGSHPFEPHVTVVGGIPCESNDKLDEWRCILKEGLCNVGVVPCRFRKEVLYVRNEDDGSSSFVWNQACVCVMEQSDEYMQLIKKTRELLGLEGDFQFKPPLCAPHYSFFYGRQNPPPPDEISIPPDFDADQVALWCTYPSSIEGVPSWKEVARFSLC